MHKKYSQYKLIGELSEQDLTNNVNNHLGEGWQLYGQPFAAVLSYGVCHYQALVIPHKETEK